MKNENNNKYLHIELHSEAERTAYIKQIINVAQNYNEKIYIRIKSRNSYVENEDNHIINNNIINVSRKNGGFENVMLDKTNYLNSYNEGWLINSIIRTIIESHNTKEIQIQFGGTSTNNTTWDYSIDIDDIYVINLTKIFGAGNEPTKAEMDEIFNNF